VLLLHTWHVGLEGDGVLLLVQVAMEMRAQVALLLLWLLSLGELFGLRVGCGAGVPGRVPEAMVMVIMAVAVVPVVPVVAVTQQAMGQTVQAGKFTVQVKGVVPHGCHIACIRLLTFG